MDPYNDKAYQTIDIITHLVKSEWKLQEIYISKETVLIGLVPPPLLPLSHLPWLHPPA